MGKISDRFDHKRRQRLLDSERAIADEALLADKGKRGGLCNRSACLAPGAMWFNTSTRAYYCRGCAHSINRFAIDDCGHPICFESLSAEADANLKFGEIPLGLEIQHG